MEMIEAQIDGGLSQKRECDFCGEEPENSVLVEKPNSMIVNGQLMVSYRAKPLHICLDCLTLEIENL